MANREFRKLLPSDLNLVLQMNWDFREGFTHESSAKKFLSNPMNWIYACIQDNQIIGFAYGYELNRLDNKGNMLYIHEVGVLDSYQRQGIGYQLLTDLKYLCKTTGICRIFLFTQKHNTAACALYEKVGGKKTSDSRDDDITYFFNDFDDISDKLTQILTCSN
ncbi:GNAT family N-acetyltransferase [Mobilitalea sibirica]|uniref:GNAT family N-acetyltransferase n=1 Tax=Mobilitalea sibirica TaxID=1462919 RepID=A0A8J7KXQ9_9FIRM|nr:GNAT family N-acetyltransferase [Mobilitalea sibirica]MBH1942102.1 GNAT family N-acetyltransferase [Mobilitalea sibirica]